MRNTQVDTLALRLARTVEIAAWAVSAIAMLIAANVWCVFLAAPIGMIYALQFALYDFALGRGTLFQFALGTGTWLEPVIGASCIGGLALAFLPALLGTTGELAYRWQRTAWALGLAGITLSTMLIPPLGMGDWYPLDSVAVGRHLYRLDAFASIDTYIALYECDASGFLCREVGRSGDVDLPETIKLHVDPITQAVAAQQCGTWGCRDILLFGSDVATPATAAP